MRPVDVRRVVPGSRARGRAGAGRVGAGAVGVGELTATAPVGSGVGRRVLDSGGAVVPTSRVGAARSLGGDALTVHDAAAELTWAVLLGVMLGVHVVQEIVQDRVGRLRTPCHVHLPHVPVPHVPVRRVRVPHHASAA